MDFKSEYLKLKASCELLRDENQALKDLIDANKRKELENVRREEFKDIDFGRLLNASIEHQTTEFDILKLMTHGTKRVVGEGVEVALFQMREIDQKDLERLLYREHTGRACLASQERVLYCLIDTEIGERINSLQDIQRCLTLKNGTILGDTERFGEGVVSVSKIGEGEAVKNFHYADYQTGRWQHSSWDHLGDLDACRSDNVLRVSFPIYHIEAERLDEIQYILLVRNVKGIKFSNVLIRSIRGYGNYGTLSLALKQLQLKDEQILEKDKFIEDQDAFIVSGVRRYLHNLATPLATMEHIINSLNDIIRDENSSNISDRFSVLLTQVNKVKDSLHRIRQTIKRTKYYQESRPRAFSLVDASEDKRIQVCLDDFLIKYLKTVDIEEAYGSKLRFELETGARDKYILADIDRLSYILDNAIRNTFQQCEILGIREVVFKIRTMYVPSSNQIVLMLRDYAGGVSEAQYESFKKNGGIQTTKPNGTGEGIPTIIENLKAMGGKEVDLFNFPMDGILYTVNFPACRSK